MISAILFAIKIILAAVIVIPLSLSKAAFFSSDRIGVYAIASVVAATVTAIAQEMNSGLIAAALIVAVGIVSVTQIKKEEGQWFSQLQSIAPFWLITVIGMCIGAGLWLWAIILTAVSYYIINFLPILLAREGKASKTEK